jgi:hypothetical protein
MNAAQASPNDGLIDITIETRRYHHGMSLSHHDLAPGEYVVVSVADQGSGIPASALPHIFEPFFTTKAKSGGTGLGLAAVHGHVTGMRGRIDVESAPDQGTRFRLFFPAVNRIPLPLAQFFDERTVPLGKGEVVLIAQSDTDLRLLYEEKIAALGYEPFGFATFAALKRHLSSPSRQADLVLLDLDLWPGLPDLGAVVDEFRPIPTLFLADPERSGLDHHRLSKVPILKKPVSSLNLATTLSSMIGKGTGSRQHAHEPDLRPL